MSTNPPANTCFEKDALKLILPATIWLISLFLLPCFCFAQNDYFQQEVNYSIEVTLDDVEHTLSGNISMEYTNNSPDALDFIYIHLWPNGYANKNTAYAQQTLLQGNANFHFAEAQDMGYIRELAFTENGTALTIADKKKDADYVKLMLSKPLAPGASTTIATSFKVKIPKTFSRLGHDGQAYQLTQWYPKPAVYDREGWHPMPYLESGEYYSEFGNFDVQITLPENYVVGATGVLQTASEYEFLDRRIAATNERIKSGFTEEPDFPASSLELKTIRYTAEQVHDFAWFADKRFYVQKGSTRLDNGHEVTTWALFTNLQADDWKYATKYLARSIEFYSENIGPYPYPQITAVENPLFAGGAMEYPMITVVAETNGVQNLDRLIAHEIGHNWFYGILATNERDYPWMDEGMNSFYENRYMQQFYEDEDADVIGPNTEKFLGGGYDIHYDELAYLYMARRRLDQPPHTSSIDLTATNYGVGAYMKPALIFNMLEAYLGKEKYDELMRRYFETWQFKHPQPADFRAIAESVSEVPLNWLFEGLLYSNEIMDYALIDVNINTGGQIKVQNRGDIHAPFPVSGLRDGEIVATKWYEGFAGSKDLDFPGRALRQNYDRRQSRYPRPIS
ncbi:MAG: M1 family metallopeptidase [Bacteroidota bacterium]